MSSHKKIVLTSEGLAKLEEELDYRVSVKRAEIAGKLKVALSFGDLSENSEYDEAKNEQAMNEGRIVELTAMLKNAEVLDEEEIDSNKVNIGCTVKVIDKEFDEEIEYSIVGTTEADPLENKISDESPLGHALIGCHVGDICEVHAPAGVLYYEITDIRRTK
ncbi:MAG: transcription elongation factor GreA [Clostridia bacterium]|nr:transcription elongation factor GreA [Clostridia bacterium]MBQ1435739.1 transcription elongation factor GreA [Clostridia bacterium]MBQ4248803.1 transcription elongation factor GreA [Clostridia bacterium]